MECRPTLLIIAITVAGATGAKWAIQSPALISIEPKSNQSPDTSDSLPQSVAQSQLSKPRKTQLRPSVITPPQHQNMDAPNTHPIVDVYTRSANKITTKTTGNLPMLLADQGIVLEGIDSNSTHVDTLFMVFFNQTNIDTEQALEIILGDWAKSEPAQAWQWIQNNDPTGVLSAYRATIVHHWLPIDANAALLAITSLPTSNDKDLMLAGYAAFIAVEEPDRAFYWAYGLTNKTTRQLVLDSVVYQWASSDPEQAILHLENIIEPEIRQQLLFQTGPALTSQMTQTNPHRSMMWTSSLNKYENEFLSPIAFQQWINKNPDEAMSWLISENDSVSYELLMTNAATTLAYQDLPVAIEYFPSMSNSIQENMASSIAFSLYQVDPNEAKNWSNNLPVPKTQQNANRGILLASVNTEPEFALQMALDFVGQEHNEVLISTAIEVDQQHPELLEHWLLDAPITQTQLSNIRSSLVRLPAD